MERVFVKTEQNVVRADVFFGILETTFFFLFLFDVAMYTGFYYFPVDRFGARKILLL